MTAAALVSAWCLVPAPTGSAGQDPAASAAPAVNRPNRVPENATFVGMAACAECHEQIIGAHRDSGMARAMQPASVADILRANPKLSLKSGRFTYTLERKGDDTFYSVTDGVNTLTEKILYAMGQGKAGQTYVYRHGVDYYESRVSFYRAVQGLDITIGHQPPTDDETIVNALGRRTPHDEIRDCFGCHTTAGVTATQILADRMVPGVNCESCHGAGSAHIEAMKAHVYDDPKIYNPGLLNGDELSQEFCGKCHRSAEVVMFMPNKGNINNVRWQPYRVFGSKCYSDDKRISCVACHDPHGRLEENPSFYDAKCMACHLVKGKPAPPATEDAPAPTEPPCPVDTKGCVTCHMPKFELPGAHLKFTDHRIRIAKPGEPYPT